MSKGGCRWLVEPDEVRAITDTELERLDLVHQSGVVSSAILGEGG